MEAALLGGTAPQILLAAMVALVVNRAAVGVAVAAPATGSMLAQAALAATALFACTLGKG